MEALRTVKRYHLSKDRSGWNFTIKRDGTVWGEIFHNGIMHGFQMQEPPELFSELTLLFGKIPCTTIANPERILTIGDKDKKGNIVSLDDYDNYPHDSVEASLWQHLESLASRIIEKAL